MADKSSRRAASNGQHKTPKSKPATPKKPVVKSTVKTASKLASDQIAGALKAGETVQKTFARETEKPVGPADGKQWFSGDLPESDVLGAFPEILRSFAEQSLTQTKTAYEATRENLEKATETLGRFVDHTGQGLQSLQVKTFDMAVLNMNHYFDYARALVAARNMSEAIEIQNAHLSKQVDLVSAQMKQWQDFSQDILANSTYQFQSQQG